MVRCLACKASGVDVSLDRWTRRPLQNLVNRDNAQTGVARQLTPFRSNLQVYALISHADADPISCPGCDGVVEVCTIKVVQEKLSFGIFWNSLVGTLGRTFSMLAVRLWADTG
jgi:hypothetical protein